MKITVERIKHHKGLSEETPAYTALVLVDGKAAFRVSNAGHGGPDMQHPIEPFTMADLKRVDEWIGENTPTISMEEYGMAPLKRDLELLCHEAVEDADSLKTIKRLVKTKLVFFKTPPAPEGGKADLYTIPLSAEGKTPAGLAKLRAAAIEKGWVVLNGLPDDKLLAAYRRAN